MQNKFSLALTLLLVCIIFLFSESNAQRAGDNIDVIGYDIELDLVNNLESPFKRSFSGIVTINAKTISETNEILFDAYNYSLTIDEVTGNGIGYTHSGNKLAIALDRTYSIDEEISVKIKYRHKDVFDTAFYCNEGLVYTDSESAGARRWLPCKDVPSDKALSKIAAKVPADVQFCGNGLLTDSIASQGTVKYVYDSRHPIATYLIAFVASKKYLLSVVNWDYIISGKGNMEVKYYYQKGETMFNLRNIMLKTNKMLDFFSEIYCDYPFEKLAFATTDKYFPWGGMENQTIVTLCPDCWIEDLICHELVHQWFGDMITPETWADIWLNEGFATYNEALWIERTYGKDKYKSAVEYEAQKYLSSNPGWAVYNENWKTDEPNDTQVFDPGITYSKAGCILFLMRYVLGDEVFFDVMKSYANEEKFRYGNVNTAQFEEFVEEKSGKDLTWFFQQWVYGPNHPVYQLNFNKEKTDDNKFKAQYMITQTQRNAGYFKMPVELEITFTDGSKKMVYEENEYNMQTYEYILDKEPVNIKFDPRNKIVLKEVK